MADTKKSLEILRRYYTTVTPEKFLEDVKRALPEENSYYDDWILSKSDGSGDGSVAGECLFPMIQLELDFGDAE